MTEESTFAEDRPRLYYRATCPRCRAISAMLTMLSRGRVQRVPLSSAEAQALISRGCLKDGQPALFYRGRFATGTVLLWRLGAVVLHGTVHGLTGQ